MDKIGICTYYNNYNYGSYLQAYALQKIVEELGYSAYLIDFNDLSKPWNRRLHDKTIFSRLKCLILNPKLLIDTLRARKIKNEQTVCSEEQKRKFDLFSKEELNFFEGDFTQAEFRAYIVGSDQVWKVSLPGLHYVFFLRFTSKHKRISYAASIGADSIPPFNKRLLTRYLTDFSSISVREATSVKLLSELNSKLEIINVLDPVLLVGKTFWEQVAPNLDMNGFILLYFLDSFDDKMDTIRNIMSQYPDSKVVSVNTGAQPTENQIAQVINPSPLEFVSLILHSRMVLTDSFHGTAFSILFGKEFYTFPRNYKIYSGQKDRLISILEMFSCSDRYLDKGVEFSNIYSINRTYVKEILNNEQEKSMNYLKSAIEKTNK